MLLFYPLLRFASTRYAAFRYHRINERANVGRVHEITTPANQERSDISIARIRGRRLWVSIARRVRLG